MRRWSSSALPAGRIPGVTSCNCGCATFSTPASCAEHTSPSMPACWARPARRRTWACGSTSRPMPLKSSRSMLVSTVTPISRGLAPLSLSSSLRQAAIMRRPPEQCTLTIHTPSSAAALTAIAVVFGMSWNLRSRNTSKPLACNASTIAGPQRVNSSLPTLTRHCAGSSCAANARAASALGKSRATIIGLRQGMAASQASQNAAHCTSAACRA